MLEVFFVSVAWVSLIYIPGFYSAVWSDAPSLFFFWVAALVVSAVVCAIHLLGEWLSYRFRRGWVSLVFSAPLLLFGSLNLWVWASSVCEGRMLFAVPAFLHFAAVFVLSKKLLHRWRMGGSG
ncbi:hypothetical protein [Pseudomonas sp. TE3610]